jgi:hypothetical protein
MATRTQPKARVMTADEVRADLAKFEAKFGMTSTEFLERYEAGKFDEPGAIGWEFACDLARQMGIPLK